MTVSALAVFGIRVAVALTVSVGAVRLNVLGEVVGAHEALVADGAGKALLTRVGPQVPLQFVGPGETLAAEQPVADKGPLARVPTKVSFQVRRLAVDLAAARDVARVNVALA